MKVNSHNVTLTPQASAMVETQIANGRFKDFSAAIQEAVFNYFCDAGNIFEEYDVTPDEVERSAKRDLAAFEKARKEGTLKRFDL